MWSTPRMHDTGPCLEWPGGRTRGKKHYVHAYRDGRSTALHRFVWEVVHGPIPAGMAVLHWCNNPPCCNLAHLSLGTRTEGMCIHLPGNGIGPNGTYRIERGRKGDR